MRILCALLVSALLGCVGSAQIVPRERRDAAVAKAPLLAPKPADDFDARLAAVENPFRVSAVVEPVSDGAPRPSADTEALLKREVRISGIFQLSDGRQSVFLNGKRFYAGDTVALKLAGREVSLRVLSIESRRITVEVGGQTYILPTR